MGESLNLVHLAGETSHPQLDESKMEEGILLALRIWNLGQFWLQP